VTPDVYTRRVGRGGKRKRDKVIIELPFLFNDWTRTHVARFHMLRSGSRAIFCVSECNHHCTRRKTEQHMRWTRCACTPIARRRPPRASLRNPVHAKQRTTHPAGQHEEHARSRLATGYATPYTRPKLLLSIRADIRIFRVPPFIKPVLLPVPVVGWPQHLQILHEKHRYLMLCKFGVEINQF